MNLLLDTHVFLWWMTDSKRLGKDVKGMIADADNYVAVSAVTVWEITIKQAVGKLDATGDIPSVLRDNGFDPFPITVDHAALAGSLPLHHTDPFDRMLVAQSMLDDFALVTRDRHLSAYGVRIVTA
jgi:PIN domain nuclease of toxin-antitoxin system